MPDVTTAAFVNAAGGFLFLLVGLAMLAVARGEARARAFGLYTALFGLLYVGDNLATGSMATIIAGIVTTLVAVLLVVRLLEGRGGLLPWGLLAVGAGVTVLSSIGAYLAGGRDPVDAASVAALVARRLYSGAGFLVCIAGAIAYRRTTPEESGKRRALVLFTLATGLFAEFLAGSPWLLGAAREADPWFGAALGLQGLVLSPMLVLLFLPTGKTPEPRLSLAALLALVAAGLLGVLHGVFVFGNGNNYGAFGIVRTIGAVLLVLAIVRHDLLGVPLPRIAVRRGPLAAGALAVLFVVAQVAQNFLSAKYGLLMGGIVAGAFLFAAHPIQQAIERRHGPPGPAHGQRPTAHAAEQEDIYRGALRLALRDKRLTRGEEADLHRLAEALGIRPGRAHEMLDEVEREARA
ncbi:MAG: hypothetical protein ACT4PT_03965 [Methanobacteriota archaeon]